MIVVKPKVNTIFSIGVFLILDFSLFGALLNQYLKHSNPPLYITILMVGSGSLGMAILLKFLWNWKSVTIGKERFEIKYPFRFSKTALTGKNLSQWQETKIKTWGGTYAETSILFHEGEKLQISQQEHTDYDKTLKYLHKKFKKQHTKR